MIVKNKLVAICVTFTVLTLLSGVLNLAIGVTTDTHFHIISRFLLCFVAIGSLVIFDLLKDKPAYVAQLVHYIGTLIVIFGIVWGSQLIEPLSPNAYRDVFLNYSAAYIVFAIYCTVKNRFKSKGKDILDLSEGNN